MKNGETIEQQSFWVKLTVNMISYVALNYRKKSLKQTSSFTYISHFQRLTPIAEDITYSINKYDIYKPCLYSESALGLTFQGSLHLSTNILGVLLFDFCRWSGVWCGGLHHETENLASFSCVHRSCRCFFKFSRCFLYVWHACFVEMGDYIDTCFNWSAGGPNSEDL